MAEPTVGKPALLLYAFAALDGSPESTAHAWEALDRLWAACRLAGAMTEPMLGIAAPEQLPVPPDGTGPFRVTASARRSTPGRLRSMFVFTEHGTAGLVVALSADQDGDAAWEELVDQWAATVAEASNEELLGVVTVLVGLSPDEASAPAVRTTGTRLACRLQGEQGVGRFDVGPGGVLVWRRESAPARTQVYVVAAEDSAEDAVDEWVWAADGRQGLMPLTRYCLNLYRTVHQRDLHRALPPVARLVAETDQRTTSLMAELARERRHELDPRALVAADEHLRAVQAATPGLLWRTVRVQDIATTVRALQANTRRHCPPDHVADGVFAADDAELTWLIDHLDREAAYLDTLARRADAAHVAAGGVITGALTRRRERITLLQTSFLGALLMALAAIQSFQYSPPITQPVKGPLIAALAAAAFGLPFLVARWSRLIPGTEPYRWPDLLAAAGFGACLGWLADTVAWMVTAGHPAPGWATATATVVAAALVVGPTAMITRRARGGPG
jgi:hypothetical protein